MVIRDYLPYQSARMYQDRGMAKWMGFFISEHTSALGHFSEHFDRQSPHQMPQEQLWLAIQQAYLHQLKVVIFYHSPGRQYPSSCPEWECVMGSIHEVSAGKIGLDSPQGYVFVKAEDMVAIHLAEEGES